MKKTLYLFPTALILIFLVLSWSDTGEYAQEKKIWSIENGLATRFADPNTTTNEHYDKLIKGYLDLIHDYPKSRLIPNIFLKLGQIYAKKNEFSKAHVVYQRILDEYPQNKDACALALVKRGQLYEEQGKEAEAMAVYSQLNQDYPLTMPGFNTPLYVVRYYLQKGKTKETQEALHKAKLFYETQAQANSVSPINFKSLSNLTIIYSNQRNWEEALRIYEEMLRVYAKTPLMNNFNLREVIASINAICKDKLKNPQKAIVIYQSMIENEPNHPMNIIFRQAIESLNND